MAIKTWASFMVLGLLIGLASVHVAKCGQNVITPQQRCDFNTKQMKTMKNSMAEFYRNISTSVDLKHLGLYKWNTKYEFSTYILNWKHTFAFVTSFKRMIKQLMKQLKPIPSTPCSSLQVQDQQQFLQQSLTFLQSVDPNVVFSSIHHIDIFNHSSGVLLQSINATSMLNYMKHALDTVSKIWKNCSTEVTSSHCRNVYLTAEIQLGKFLFWFDNNEGSSLMLADEGVLLSEFVQLLTVGRVDWMSGKHYMTYFPTEMHRNMDAIQIDSTLHIKSVFEVLNASTSNISHVLKDIDLLFQSRISELVALHSRYKRNKFEETNLQYWFLLGTTLCGLIGNVIIIYVYRPFFKSAKSYNKTLLAVLALSDLFCLLLHSISVLLDFLNVVPLCRMEYPTIILKTLSNWTLGYLCTLRALSLLFPFRIKSSLSFSIALKVYGSLILAPLAFYSVTAVIMNLHTTSIVSKHCIYQDISWLAYFATKILLVVNFLVPTNVPLIIIIITNVLVTYVLMRRKSSDSVQNSNSKSASRQERQVLVMLVLSGSAFLICNLPNEVMIFIHRRVFAEKEVSFARMGVIFFHGFYYLNKSLYFFIGIPVNYGINFYLYLLSQGFRQELYQDNKQRRLTLSMITT